MNAYIGKEEISQIISSSLRIQKKKKEKKLKQKQENKLQTGG